MFLGTARHQWRVLVLLKLYYPTYSIMIARMIPPTVNQSPFLNIGDFGTNIKKALTAKKNSDAPKKMLK